MQLNSTHTQQGRLMWLSLGQAQRPGAFSYIPETTNLRKEFWFLIYRKDLDHIDLAQGESECKRMTYCEESYCCYGLQVKSLYCCYGPRKFLLEINSASLSTACRSPLCVLIYSLGLWRLPPWPSSCVLWKRWHVLPVVWGLWLVSLGMSISPSPKPTAVQSWILSM